MRNLKKYSLLLFLLTVLKTGYAQQTVQFSQYVFNELAVNPAYAGYKEDLTVNMSFRTQWVGIPGAPQTGTASVDGLTNSTSRNVGLGFLVTTDRLGPENTLSVYGNYAYRLRLDDEDTKRLSFGIGVGFNQYSLDGSQFVAGEANDGALPIGRQSTLTPDVRFGIYYNTADYYVGLSALDLLSSAGKDTVSADGYKLIKLARHLYLTAGLLIPVSESVDFKPSIMLKEDFRSPTNMDLNASFLISKTVWIGASYRTGVNLLKKSNLSSGLDADDAVSGILSVYVNPRIRVGYSYDYTTSKLGSYQLGSHEFSISYTFVKRDSRTYCPHYF